MRTNAKKKIFVLSALTMFVVAPSVNAIDTTSSTDNVDGKVESLLEWFKQGKASGRVRTLWYQRDFDGPMNDWCTGAVGGNLKYETGSLAGFSLGAGFKTGQGAGWNSSSDVVYPQVLAKSDDGSPKNYTALDEYYVKYKGYDTTVTVGAQPIFTPWMKGFDNRTTPIKYRGISLKNKTFAEEANRHKLEFDLMYLDKYLAKEQEDFESMSSAYSGDIQDDGGLFAGGVTYRAPGDLRFRLWDYYFEDTLNDVYVDGRYRQKITDDIKMELNLKYLNRQDTGDANAGELDTWQAGGDIGVSAYGFTVTSFYGQNGNDFVGNPLGSEKIVIQQIGANLKRPEEDVYSIKLAYDFGAIGVKNLEAYAWYGYFDTPDSGENASTNYDQIDFDLQYKLGGWFKGCLLRLRYAIRNADENTDGTAYDSYDIETILTYRF